MPHRAHLFALCTWTIAMLGCPPAPVPPPPDASDAAVDASPPPPPPPVADAAPGDVYAQACAALVAVGCPEVQPGDGGTVYAKFTDAGTHGRSCADVLRMNAPVFPMPAACLAKAKTKADVHACNGDAGKTFIPCP